jgi:hypothetical protein
MIEPDAVLIDLFGRSAEANLHHAPDKLLLPVHCRQAEWLVSHRQALIAPPTAYCLERWFVGSSREGPADEQFDLVLVIVRAAPGHGSS